MSEELHGRHVSNTCTRMVLELVSHKGGAPAVAETMRRAGETRPPDVLLDDAGWSSYGEFRRLIEAAGDVLGGIDHLRDIWREADLAGGSMPSAAEMLQLLGSPGVLFAELNKGRVSMLTFLEIEATEITPTEWRIETFMKPGFESFPGLCAFAAGIHPMTPRLFGFEHVVIRDEECIHEGDERCVFHVAWEENDEDERNRNALEQRIAMLERRLESFQTTVGELVLADDLDSALERVVAAAARAVRAPGFILAVEPERGMPSRFHGHGLDPSEAARIGALLLAGEPCPEVGDLVVDIASSRRHYGRLAAYDPEGIVLAEGPMLGAYARLAATALDSATALEEARREAARARALLELSAALAEIATTDEMARSLARATPAVIGADQAVVSVWDRTRSVVRIVAVHGHTEAFEQHALGLELPESEGMPSSIQYLDPDTADEYAGPLLEAAGAVAAVLVPIVVDAEPEGWLVASVLEGPERLAPDPELEARLLGLAAQASTALRNARLVEQIRHQALHDALTGLPNRALILDRTEQLLARGRRDHVPVAALFIDLDGFKEINDTLGHATGDQLLRAVAARLGTAIRESDTLARLGGDEFVVLVDCGDLDAGPDLVAERLLDVLREPFVLEGRPETPLTITASIGIANALDRGSAGDLLRDADVALYQAKDAGKDRAVVFAPEMQTVVRDRLALGIDLRHALEDGQFFLVYQPILDLQGGAVTGVEALLRWRHPERGVVLPDGFIPALEQSGLIVEVGSWVLTEACRQTAEWRAGGHELDVSVNVSARQLEADGLAGDVARALAASGLPADALILEITETTIMQDTDATIGRLTALKAIGVRLAVDDFGTGYSSLAYLRKFPVDALKIDRSFINAVAESPEAAALIHTLVHLGKALGLATFAEGIEDTDQFDRLRIEDCDSGQGFLFARPLTVGDLELFLDGTREEVRSTK